MAENETRPAPLSYEELRGLADRHPPPLEWYQEESPFVEGQFQHFDGLDNRRELIVLLDKLGNGLPEPLADRRRAAFLQSLIPQSVSCFKDAPVQVSPCGTVEAFFLLTAICGVLGVRIDQAARKLDETVRRQK